MRFNKNSKCKQLLFIGLVASLILLFQKIIKIKQPVEKDVCREEDAKEKLSKIDVNINGISQKVNEIYKATRLGNLNAIGLSLVSIGVSLAGVAYGAATPPQKVVPDIAIPAVIAVIAGLALQWFGTIKRWKQQNIH